MATSLSNTAHRKFMKLCRELESTPTVYSYLMPEKSIDKNIFSEVLGTAYNSILV